MTDEPHHLTRASLPNVTINELEAAFWERHGADPLDELGPARVREQGSDPSILISMRIKEWLLAAYKTRQENLRVITGWDRNVAPLLLPEEC
jgi:hypothetical protein